MRLFGEYLVEKKIVSENQLLDALIAQIDTQASIAKISRELGLLQPHEFLAILKKQSIERISFIEAGLELKMWTREKSEHVFSAMAVDRTPLGEILVRNQVIDIVTLTKALDDFFAERAQGDLASKIAPIESAIARFKDMSEWDVKLISELESSIKNLSSQIADGDLIELRQYHGMVCALLADLMTREPQSLSNDLQKKIKDVLVRFFEVVHALRAAEEKNEDLVQILKSEAVSKSLGAIADGVALLEFDLSLFERRAAP